MKNNTCIKKKRGGVREGAGAKKKPEYLKKTKFQTNVENGIMEEFSIKARGLLAELQAIFYKNLK